jgi:myo-inositol-1(or 4)-monophosphatase
MPPSLSQLIDWSKAAGAILRAGLGQEHTIDHKGEIDLVTEMDRRSEDYLIGQVRAAFPAHTIVSEEAGHLDGSSDHCWYIDPLDGTLNYAHGVPIFCVSVAYAEHGQMQLGVVYDPMQDECFSAERGQGARLNGRKIMVSAQTGLDQAFLVTGFPYDVRQNDFNNIAQFGRMLRTSQSVRRMGSAALDLGYIAAGRFDGYWEIRLKPWDLAAGALIVEEAGGIVTAFDGSPDFLRPPYGIVAANRLLHGKLVQALQ